MHNSFWLLKPKSCRQSWINAMAVAPKTTTLPEGKTRWVKKEEQGYTRVEQGPRERRETDCLEILLWRSMKEKRRTESWRTDGQTTSYCLDKPQTGGSEWVTFPLEEKEEENRRGTSRPTDLLKIIIIIVIVVTVTIIITTLIIHRCRRRPSSDWIRLLSAIPD